MNSPILVTGGTGNLGRHIVSHLRDAGCKVRVLSRSGRPAQEGIQFITGDLLTGEGVGAAVDGVALIVHCASSSKGDAKATRNLVQAAASQPRKAHLTFVSIVGAERVSFGYIREKLESEHIIADSGLPWTILRATQFYNLILSGAQAMAKLPVMPVPSGFKVQPIDPAEVAVRLVELALGEPAGRVPDMGGPQITSFADLVRVYLQVSHKRRLVVPIWMPGIAAIRAGALVVPDHAEGQRTWEEFLAERLH